MLKRYFALLVLLELAALTTIVATGYYWSSVYEILPDRIPSHFGFSGQPDGWVEKENIPFLLLAMAVVYIVLTIAGLFPKIINFPVKITPQNEQNSCQSGLS